jgi:hypothetical protein
MRAQVKSTRQLMSRNSIGIICRLAGVAVAFVGLIPATLLLNPWRKADKLTQIDETYFGTNLLKSAGIAIAGLVAGYVLLRLGSHFKSKRPPSA